jgi:hypothetical protein
MKKKSFIIIVLCFILAAYVLTDNPPVPPIGADPPVSVPSQSEETAETEEEPDAETEAGENAAARNFRDTAVILMIIVGVMTVLMNITKINRRNLNRM